MPPQIGTDSIHLELRQKCSQCSLQELCLPRGLYAQDLEQLDTVVVCEGPHHAGDFLLHTGDRFRSLYAVRSGSYKSYTIDRDGREQIWGFHLQGEIMGLDAIHPEQHLCNVVALDTATACSLPFDQLSAIASRLPGLRSQIFKTLSKSLSEQTIRSRENTAEERLAAFLVDLSTRLRERGFSERDLHLNMPRRDIANYLHLTAETISRSLARFQSEGLILVDHREIHLLDLSKLTKRARCENSAN
ncbi:MAG: helix-turn-helix domain-containing protein [Gammaproteobacteria bacterium]